MGTSKNTLGVRPVTKYTGPRFEVGLPLENLKGGIMGGLGGLIGSLGGSSGIGSLISSIFSSIFGGIGGLL
jgi:hypothetical protein